MVENSTSLYLLVAATIVLLVIQRLSHIGSREKDLPPGPPTTPLLGNLLDIPPRYAHLYFQKLSKQYGPVISLKLFNHNMVVLNDAASVREILDKNSSSSSERPPMHINDTLISKGAHILIVNSQHNALLRKLWNMTLAKNKVDQHISLQNAEGTAVLFNIMNEPDNYYTEMRRYSASLTLAIAYGKRSPTFFTKDESGFSPKVFYDLEHRFNFFLEVGAAPPLDLLPILKLFPGAWKKQAAECRKDMVQLYCNQLYEEVKTRMKSGHRNGCWMEELIEKNKEDNLGLSEEALAWNGGVMMEGGSDTTSGALLTFTLAAVLHPEAVKEAWKELDEVVGQDRSPMLEDNENLPFCNAFLREVMRWRPVAPAGVPHVTTQDLVINGYRIPKNTVVVGNTWAVLHDEALFQDPDRFDPSRYLHSEFGVKEGVSTEAMRWNLPYGAGRRICLGQWLAENSLKINIPKLLWAFKFDYKMDPQTKEPIPVSDDKFEPGHLTAPLPFACDIRPRTNQIAKVIKEEYEREMLLLEKYEGTAMPSK